MRTKGIIQSLVGTEKIVVKKFFGSQNQCHGDSGTPHKEGAAPLRAVPWESPVMMLGVESVAGGPWTLVPNMHEASHIKIFYTFCRQMSRKN